MESAADKSIYPSNGMPDCEATAIAAALTAQWGDEYETRTGNRLFEIELGAYTYAFDTTGERVVCVRGHSTGAVGPRDSGRQKGHPRPAAGDHKGHLVAHSMGGGLDINLVNQSAGVNLGKRWRDIEKLAAKNPGTAIAIHLIYEDGLDRPAAFEYGYDHPESGFLVEHFINP